MPVLYKPFQSTLGDEDQPKQFYPRVQLIGNVSTEQIAKEITGYCSLSPGDVKNTLDNLVTVMTLHLQNSESVTLDGFGSFRMSMRSRSKGVETADAVSAAQATLHVKFIPAFTRNPDRSVATRSLVTGAKCVNVNTLNVAAAGNAEGDGNSGA